MKLKIRFLVLVLLTLFSTSVWAQSFVVKSIQIQGLQRISRATVLNYLPIKTGQRFNPDSATHVITVLYKTGFFSNIELGHRGRVLVLIVQERPTIGQITFSGNHLIATAQLKTALKNLGLIQGQVFKRSVLQSTVTALQSEYYSQGKYNARVTYTLTHESQNRVAIALHFSEGLTAKIHQIQIVGNHAFKEKVLLKQFVLTTPHLFSFISGNDQYSASKMQESLQKLSEFYLNHGYVRMRVVSYQVAISPNRKSVYIIVRINEGAKYDLSGYKLAGQLIYPRSVLAHQIKLTPNTTFSRQNIINTTQKLSSYYSARGYAFVNVDPVPRINTKNKTVFITFMVRPGNLIYVNRISFTGNTKTSGLVLRSNISQMEGGLVSQKNIKESERQLRLLGYLKGVSVKMLPVPGKPNEVDLNYNVTETPSASATFTVGAGTEGPIFGIQFTQQNFLGTGKYVGINFSQSSYSQVYNFTYNNPYYTVGGVQRGFNFYFTQTNPDVYTNGSGYTMNTAGAAVTYSIPFINHNNSVQVGYGAEHIVIRGIGIGSSTQLLNFHSRYGSYFTSLTLTGGWTYNGLNQAIFPTQGLYQNLAANVALPVSNSRTLEYATLTYSARYYHPLGKHFVFKAAGTAGYGAGYGMFKSLPFFENFFAGGIGTNGVGTIRGYATNSLGPQDSLGDSLGGASLLNGTVAVILPVFKPTIRTSVFMDAGNVFKNGPQFSKIVVSSGVAVQWRSPIGPFEFSLADPFDLGGKFHEPFQFSIGTAF